MAIAAPKSYDTSLGELLEGVGKGTHQLPEFQRSWTWDDGRIRNIIASLTQGYPMGALMRLECGGGEVRLKYRAFEGTHGISREPDYLVLDGQQRLTSLYCSLFGKDPVSTSNERGQKLSRFYYLDMRKCLDPEEDREDAVISISDKRVVTEDIGRKVVLDLTSREREIEELMFPANLVFDSQERDDWFTEFIEHYGLKSGEYALWKHFKEDVLRTMEDYKIPVITLDKTTPREAVCKVFENVNTGGVSLTVFELVTAAFATYDFDLRGNWNKVVRPRICAEGKDIRTDLMQGVDETTFLTSMTLYTTYRAKRAGTKGSTSCKKKDVLALRYEDYVANLDALLDGFDMARDLLIGECVFRMRDLPYTTQLIPLAATCAYIGRKTFDRQPVKATLRRWLWCGIFGEMYGGANETRYANDIEDLVAEIEGKDSAMRTVNAAYFQSTRLLGLQTRNSAAYKGVMALVFRENCLDFVDGAPMTMVKSMETPPDIHHIFPRAYCEKTGLERTKWNSIVNKTPLIARTNREIGGVAPSKYLPKIMKDEQVDGDELRRRVESHLVDYDALAADDFDTFFLDRAKRLLDVIEQAMGKEVPDRASDETVAAFGRALS
ncbi:hypothetical protein B5F79_03170 [Olsenella sp. An285]|uniref:GmrSD restriction endonuclease domain-containing protein n=1 Tax=Olsenella sp. An285 TaxID=1965621 RepID=UPI000B399164|nr:DUF262 domain-containing protein [Olsenella sp. An285]OUO47830.1 hypothetical protein B5F79_03170 [Olsenella sp. An285]